MSAKHKLNALHVQGALVVAGLLGIVTDSWTVFWLTLTILTVGDLLSGAIRK